MYVFIADFLLTINEMLFIVNARKLDDDDQFGSEEEIEHRPFSP
jgi:hypothetical protein